MKGVVDRFLGAFQGFSLQNRHEARSGAEDLTLRLPNEVLEKIFCHLGDQQVSQAAGVCRRWGAVVISMTNRFTYVLEDKLESEKARLSVIRTKMLEPERVTHPQLLVHVAWEGIREVCNTLPDDVLYRLPSALRDRPKRDRPKFFSSIVGIAIINRRIAMARAIPVEGERRRFFCEISKQLAAMGAIAAARKFTTEEPTDNPHISSVISEIVKTLMVRGEIDRAQTMASTSFYHETSANYFCEISKGLVAKGEIKRARAFAERALSHAWPELFGSKISPTALCKICEQFTVMGDMRRALKVADRALKTLGNEMNQEKYVRGLYEVCKQLAKMGGI